MHKEKGKKQDEVGVATGLVVSQAGGDVVPIEVATMVGDGKLNMTGRLQEIMRESVQTALGYIRSQAESLEVPPDFEFDKRDIHIHVPEGGDSCRGAIGRHYARHRDDFCDDGPAGQ